MREREGGREREREGGRERERERGRDCLSTDLRYTNYCNQNKLELVVWRYFKTIYSDKFFKIFQKTTVMEFFFSKVAE